MSQHDKKKNGRTDIKIRCCSSVDVSVTPFVTATAVTIIVAAAVAIADADTHTAAVPPPLLCYWQEIEFLL